MSSGVSVAPLCSERFQEIKLKHLYRYVIFKLSDDLREIVVEKCGEKGDTYDAFLGHLKAAQGNGECRYAVYDAEYNVGDQSRNKLVFVMWAPEEAKTKQKMVYTSSKDALKKKLDGVAKEMQATDADEVSWEAMLALCMSSDRT